MANQTIGQVLDFIFGGASERFGANLLPVILPVFMLALAALPFDFPPGFYKYLVRIIVCLAAISALLPGFAHLVKILDGNREPFQSTVVSFILVVVFAAIAFLFNPFFPFYLSRDKWVVIDILCCILFFFAPAIWIVFGLYKPLLGHRREQILIVYMSIFKDMKPTAAIFVLFYLFSLLMSLTNV